MTGRCVDLGIRILAALALLVAVMSSPIRPTGLAYRFPSPNCLPRNFAILENWHSGQPVMSARLSVRQPDPLQADIEGELDADIEDGMSDTSPLAAVSFDDLPSPLPEPFSGRVGSAVALAARPLRC